MRNRNQPLSCSVTLEKKGAFFGAWTILVGQPPKKKKKKEQGATAQLSPGAPFRGGGFDSPNDQPISRSDFGSRDSGQGGAVQVGGVHRAWRFRPRGGVLRGPPLVVQSMQRQAAHICSVGQKSVNHIEQKQVFK